MSAVASLFAEKLSHLNVDCRPADREIDLVEQLLVVAVLPVDDIDLRAIGFAESLASRGQGDLEIDQGALCIRNAAVDRDLTGITDQAFAHQAVDIIQFLLREFDLPLLRIDLGLQRLDLLAVETGEVARCIDLAFNIDTSKPHQVQFLRLQLAYIGCSGEFGRDIEILFAGDLGAQSRLAHQKIAPVENGRSIGAGSLDPVALEDGILLAVAKEAAGDADGLHG